VTELRAAFVMEQSLGHVTHFQNLRTAVSRQVDVVPTWVPIPFKTAGLERWVPGYRTNWSIRASIRARRCLSQELARREHHALFFHTQVTSLFSSRLMRRVPSIISLDATPLNYDSMGAAYGHRPATDSWIDARKHDLNRQAFHAAAAMVTWSEWAKASLVGDYDVPAERVTVIPPGASRSYLQIGAERLIGSDRSDRPVRLLFVGADFARKGGPLLLESAREARTVRPFELHVVTQQAVEARPGVIVHRGLQPNSPDLMRLFREADAFILPSYGECLALVLMEASAAGLPIIATDVGALSEAAIPGRSAIVVEPGDGRSLRSAIETIVNDESLRLRYGAAAHELARSQFNAERNGQRIVALLRSIARSSDRRVA
jgi:glycosyltransferase involved in cell wall biosynthesis